MTLINKKPLTISFIDSCVRDTEKEETHKSHERDSTPLSNLINAVKGSFPFSQIMNNGKIEKGVFKEPRKKSRTGPGVVLG